MGTDIHTYKEQRVNGKWIFIGGDRYTDRNYEAFGFLTGGDVRREVGSYSMPKLKGLPEDLSESVQYFKENEGGHSSTWLDGTELFNIDWNRTLPVSGMMKKEQLDELLQSIEVGSPNYSLVDNYCQWTNQEGWVNFEVDVPLRYICKDLLKFIEDMKREAGWDNIKPEDIRLVFWFDS